MAMGAYECWQNQRGKLAQALSEVTEGSSATYLVRHALSQVEQDTLSGMADDTLRQQTGVLFSCLKSAAGFLDVTVSAKEWQALTAKPKNRKPVWLLPCLAAIGQILLGLYFYFKGETFVWIAMLAVMLVAAAYLPLNSAIHKPAPLEERRVTLRPDTEKLLTVLDAQLRSIDRYVMDLQYLNEALTHSERKPGPKLIGAVAELLEALYECEEDVREQALPAAGKVLGDLGLEAVDYSPKDKRLFTILPSIQDTRTLIPALVSQQDGRLVRMGAATVQKEAAGTEEQHSTKE